jgi:hypothetical protein
MRESKPVYSPALDGRLPEQERYWTFQLRPTMAGARITVDQFTKAFLALRFDEQYVFDVIQRKTRVGGLAELQALCCTDWLTDFRVEAILTTLLESKLIVRREINLRSDWSVSWLEVVGVVNRAREVANLPRRLASRKRSNPIAGKDYPA